MKNKLLIVLIFLILILCSFSICYADEEDELKMESFELTSPTSGVYGVGTEVIFTLKYNKPIKGTLPKLQIYFGRSDANKIDIDEVELSTFTDTVQYKYTIKSGDNGLLNCYGFKDAINYAVETEDGKSYYLSLFGGDFKNKIYAETTIERANFSNAEYEWVTNSEKDRNGLKIKINKINLIENNDYYLHFSHEKNENLSVFDYESVVNNSDIWKGNIGLENTIYYPAIDDIVAEDGDIYLWICEVDKKTNIPKILVNGEKIERLNQLPLGTRLIAYFFDDETSTFCWETEGNNERKINIKIGTISDISILKSIKNGESDCMQKLLNYAKSADSIYTGTVRLGTSGEVLSDMNLLNKGYYYVYMELEDENGKYYPVEDVSLYQALITDSKKTLCDYLDSRFSWNLSEEPIADTTEETKTIDDTTAKNILPNTGIETIIILFVVVSILAIFINIKLKEYKDIG